MLKIFLLIGVHDQKSLETSGLYCFSPHPPIFSSFGDSLLEAAGERGPYPAQPVSCDSFGSGTHGQRFDFLSTQKRRASSRPTLYHDI